MLNISVNFDFCFMKKLWDLAHEKLVNIQGGHHVGTNIHWWQPYLKIAIYVLKSANGGLLCRPLYAYRMCGIDPYSMLLNYQARRPNTMAENPRFLNFFTLYSVFTGLHLKLLESFKLHITRSFLYYQNLFSRIFFCLIRNENFVTRQ